jgi:hypothetical protein
MTSELPDGAGSLQQLGATYILTLGHPSMDTAMPNPLWMQPPYLRRGSAAGHIPKAHPDQPHLSWPWGLPIKDSVGFELEDILHRNPGKGCQVVKYVFDVDDPYRWRFEEATTSLDDLKGTAFYARPQNSRGCLLYEPSFLCKHSLICPSIASSLQDEAVRALGFRLGIPPSFFMLPAIRLRVIAGATCKCDAEKLSQSNIL